MGEFKKVLWTLVAAVLYLRQLLRIGKTLERHGIQTAPA